jgi:hypothetical protein
MYIKMHGPENVKSLIWCTLLIKYLGDQVKKSGMSRGCDMYERQVRCIQGFGGET